MQFQKERWAEVISVVLGPQILAPVLMLLLLRGTGAASGNARYIAFMLFFFLIGLPFMIVYIATKRKWISAWDMPIRRERYGYFAMYIIFFAIALALIHRYASPTLLSLLYIVFAATVVNTFITLFWKISIHMAFATIAILLINALLGWQLLYLFLLLPPIFWARYYLKRHTPAQLTAGVLLNMIITLLGLFYFGLLP